MFLKRFLFLIFQGCDQQGKVVSRCFISFFLKINFENPSESGIQKLDYHGLWRSFPYLSPILCPVAQHGANTWPELRWQLSHGELARGGPRRGERLQCNRRHLFVTNYTDSPCLSLEQGHYSQLVTHGCTAGPADGARAISILHVPSAKFAISFRMLLIAYFFTFLASSEKWMPLLVIWQAAEHTAMHFVIKLKGKVIKTLGCQPWIWSESLKF